jgi:hypothetical protein
MQTKVEKGKRLQQVGRIARTQVAALVNTIQSRILERMDDGTVRCSAAVLGGRTRIQEAAWSQP